MKNKRNTLANRILSSTLACVLLTGTVLSSTFTAHAQEDERVLPSGTSYTDIADEIESFVSEHEETTAAMLVSVFDSDEVIYENYFGCTDIENQAKADENSVIEWGSVSKTLIWVSVMQLWEQDKIDLDADIKTYLPDGFLTNLKYDEPITMKNLMNHNAGFQEVLSDLFSKEYNGSDLEALLSKNQPQQIYKPGTVTAYSNWSSTLAAYIVERISGQTFSEYVHSNIFEKLDMEQTAILPDLSDNEWVKAQRDKLMCYTTTCVSKGDAFYYIGMYPAGMCTSTLKDFRTYGQALITQQEGVLFENESTYKELYSATDYCGDTDIIKNSHGFWALHYSIPLLGHGGNTDGCSSFLLLDPQSEVGMVIMTNQSNESIYNSEMPELVFGKFDKSESYNNNTGTIKGLFKTARTIEEGPLSFYSLFSYFTIDEDLSDTYYVYEEQDGIAKINAPYGDYLKASPSEYIPDAVSLILLVFSIVYSIITLLIGGCIVRPIKNRIKKSKGIEITKSPFNKWNYIACGIISLWTVNTVVLVFQLLSYAPSSNYIWQSALMGAFAVLMVITLVFTIRALRKSESTSVGSKIKCFATVIALLACVLNILYFDMYQFWAL